MKRSAGLRRRIWRHRGRMVFLFLCAMLASLIEVGPGNILNGVGVFILIPAPEFLRELEPLLKFLVMSVGIGGLFCGIALALILFVPRLSASVDLAALAWLAHAVTLSIWPEFGSLAQGHFVIAVFAALWLTQSIAVKTRLTCRALPWRLRLKHRFWLPMPPEEAWKRFCFLPGHEGDHYDPGIETIHPADADGVIRVDYVRRFGETTMYYTIPHEAPPHVMTRACGMTREEALTNLGFDTIRFTRQGSGTFVEVTERPSATLNLQLGVLLQDFFADYWDRAEAHLSGHRDWSTVGALMDKA